MNCPYCRAPDSKVIDSRLNSEGDSVRRRRECIACSERFTSYEMIEINFPRILKRNGSTEVFIEKKLKSGLMKAFEKSSIRLELLDALSVRIMAKLRAFGEREVSSALLGAWTMAELKCVDEVAYVRFASVHHKFKNLNAFQTEIEKLKAIETAS